MCCHIFPHIGCRWVDATPAPACRAKQAACKTFIASSCTFAHCHNGSKMFTNNCADVDLCAALEIHNNTRSVVDPPAANMGKSGEATCECLHFPFIRKHSFVIFLSFTKTKRTWSFKPLSRQTCRRGVLVSQCRTNAPYKDGSFCSGGGHLLSGPIDRHYISLCVFTQLNC